MEPVEDKYIFPYQGYNEIYILNNTGDSSARGEREDDEKPQIGSERTCPDTRIGASSHDL